MTIKYVDNQKGKEAGDQMLYNVKKYHVLNFIVLETFEFFSLISVGNLQEIQTVWPMFVTM